MTQVELPQLSLQHYLDLLRRRRWQFVPVSLLGLLVGGLIAFFIPRYYVAETLIEHHPVPGEEPRRGVEDPFRSIIDFARETIPLAVGETMRELQWPEAFVADEFERSQLEREVRQRVVVYDHNAGKERTYAQLRVTYSDRDGKRAAAFLNRLIDVWTQKRLRELREPADRARELANESVADWDRTYEALVLGKRQLEQRYRIAPDVELSVQRELMSMREGELARLRAELRGKSEQRAGLARSLAADRDLLAATPARVQPTVEQLLAQAQQLPEGVALLRLLLAYRQSLENFHEGTAMRRSLQRGLEQAERRLRTLIAPEHADADGTIANPAHAALLQRVAAAEAQLADLVAAEGRLVAEVEAQQRRLDELIVGHDLYERQKRQLAEADAGRRRALDDVQKHEAVLAQLTSRLPVQRVHPAFPPPRPTDPNILIVALIGCVLGLAAAIALILLFDVLQGSFKTVDDVERGLPVPVLGGISHLETDEERAAVARRRRRASAVAFVFVALVATVVTIFYVDPTRLPPLVRDGLSVLLGGR